METGGRRWERMQSMSAPVRPAASMPRACRRATMVLFTSPPYTIVTTSSISASVTRRPFTIFVSMPSFAAMAVALRPPPCTRIFLPSMLRKSLSSWRSCASSSTTAPPTLMMKRLSPCPSLKDALSLPLSLGRGADSFSDCGNSLLLEYILLILSIKSFYSPPSQGGAGGWVFSPLPNGRG